MSATESPVDDLDVIVPEEGRVQVGDIECRAKRLKTREMLSLLKVLTRGLGGGLAEVRIDFESEDAGSQLAGLIVLALPEAMDEFTSFLTTVLEPVDTTRTSDLKVALVNPEFDVLLDAFEVIAVQEADDLSALLGKARRMWTSVSKVYGSKGKATEARTTE